MHLTLVSTAMGHSLLGDSRSASLATPSLPHTWALSGSIPTGSTLAAGLVFAGIIHKPARSKIAAGGISGLIRGCSTPSGKSVVAV